MLHVHKKIAKLLSTLLILGVFLLQNILTFIPFSYAYESTDDTFIYYKQRIEGLLQDMEREFRVNNAVSDSLINTIRSNVQEAYNRLPDRGTFANTNASIEKSVQLYLDLAQKNKSSQTHVSNAATQTARFLNEAKIEQISGGITANPTNGNAPLTSSFFATAKDPSGVIIPDSNYIWWMREKGGARRELGRGPLLTYTFSKEGNYQIFLDVVSDSRNSKGKIDVLPLTTSQDIEVRPRLGNVILLINGVNVSNIDQLKISPAVGKLGILFDATASRAVSNGVISKTEWDFGNGNTSKYDGPPIVERQIFSNEGVYRVTLNITSNQGQPFRKDITLVVRDPSAVISAEKETAFLGEEIRMSAKTYLSNTANVEYTWQVQDDIGKKVVATQVGSTFSYKFQKVGQYVITLTTRSPNGNTDTDSKTITIESHPPTVNLDTPYPINKEKPNTIVFDASRSFDLDTKSARGLTYTWVIDGEKVDLDNVTNDGAKGTYTFREKGQHNVSLTVANAYGRVTTVDRTFDVTTLLTVGVNITPRAAPIGTQITFQARAPQASFFEWDVGDGSPPINGTSDSIVHTYKKTGIYTVSLRVKNASGNEENSISRTVYITDTDSPFALIDITNPSGTIVENPNGCISSGNGGAFLVNRSENTTIDGNKSVNVDGNTSGLTYTWKYIGRVKTGPILFEKFTELGCFPIELTVRSEKNGSTHTSKRFIEIRNTPPKLTSITSNVDTTKKDSQKLLVTVNANGVRDDDGVITSYVWYYTTESDSEKQNVRITQLPSTTFVLPNISEKYYFGVILEDNDGTRVDSAETLAEQVPLITSNDDANVNMPLINLSVDKTQVLTDDIVNFSVTAKNILGTDITNKSEYYWDFNGDGHTDKRSSEPTTSYSYQNSGRYNMKVKVVNNGVSNTKYQIIYVKNELKAAVRGYRYGNAAYFVNTSKGSYDKVEWNYAGNTSENQYSFMLPWPMSASSGTVGTLTVKAGASELSTAELSEQIVEEISKPESGIALQTFPAMKDGVISVDGAGERILISAFGNVASEYAIDIDTKIDSDLDGVPDNDKDNKDTPSFTDGSVFAITNLANVKARNREIKLSLIGSDGATIAVQKIPVVFNFIPGNDTDTTDLTATGTVEAFSNADKANLEQLQSKIRSLESDDRIIFTQKYNALIENWSDLHDRTQNLLEIQRETDESVTLDEKSKEEISKLIDIILVGDAQATNEISVASRVIEGLIKVDNPDRDYIIERLEQIKAHPANLTDNKILGKEILQKVETNSDLSTADKLLLKSQLQIIVNGGQESIPDAELIQPPIDISGGGGFLGFIKGALWIFAILIAIILGLILLGYIFYRFSRKGNVDMGFQDFLIDSIAHNKQPNKEPIRKEAEAVVKAVEVKPEEINNTIFNPLVPPAPPPPPPPTPVPPMDPIATIGLPSETSKSDIFTVSMPNPVAEDPLEKAASINSPETTTTIDPLGEMPEVSTRVEQFDNDPLNNTDSTFTPKLDSVENSEKPPEAVLVEVIPAPPKPETTIEEVHDIPDWLKPLPKTSKRAESIPEEPRNNAPLISPPPEKTIVTTDTSSILFDPAKTEKIETPDLPIDVPSEISGGVANPGEINEISGTILDEKLPLIETHQEENISAESRLIHEDEELVPDWLKPVTEEAPATEDIIPLASDTQISNMADEYIPPIITPPGDDAELPEWLKASLQETPPEGGEKNVSRPKKRKPSKKEKNPTQNQNSGETQNTGISQDIPDWLK